MNRNGMEQLQKNVSMDGVHLNSKGYAIWKKQLGTSIS